MNTKASLLATALGLAMFSSASGQVVIDVTGSTAGRSAVHGRIINLLTGVTFSWNGNASVTSATRAIYKGTYDGKAVTVRTFWSGSAAGVRDVANAPQLAASYFDKATTPTGAEITSPVLAPASAETVSEIGFSDVFQSSTAFTANPLADESSVAVLPFLFMKNDGAPAVLTNVTANQFRALYTALGEAPLSLFTGNIAHNSTTVYATGRNNESGTRITVQAETGTGVFAQLAQYQGTGDPATLSFVGNGGYSSGGNVSTLLGATLPAGQALIGYIGVSDGITAAAGGATYLTYNGVAYSEEAVRNGQYSMWGYLHQFSRNISGATLGDGGTTQLFYNSLRAGLISTPGSGTIGIETMKVERAADGATITPK
ncbi:MAG: hypothetical protein EOP87_19035 [Verrucomicrobiaceae bacterium]|nr:MAG: hypothetical protein EOP87_19035 [Verrucomicrobiaceae bacterium]